MIIESPRLKAEKDEILPKIYLNLVEQSVGILNSLPKLDYDSLRAELRELNMPLSESPTLQQLSYELQQMQGFTDRAIQILMDANYDYVMKKRIVDTLEKGYSKFSGESSADKRTSDTVTKLSDFLLMVAESDAFHKATESVAKNLESKVRVVSRRIAALQSQINLGTGQIRGTPDQSGVTIHRESDEIAPPNESGKGSDADDYCE